MTSQHEPLSLDEAGPLVFGGNIIGWTLDQEETHAVMNAFLDLGGKAIDTADYYTEWMPESSFGKSETFLGHWLEASGRRAEVLIASKVGRGKSADNLRRDTILRSIEGSLTRLRTDYLDTYYVHRDDENVPLLEVLTTLDGLVRQGLVRSLGYCWTSPERLAEIHQLTQSHGLTPITWFQHEYNILDHRPLEDSYPTLLADPAVKVLGFHGLKSGYLSGRYIDPAYHTAHSFKIEALLKDPRHADFQRRLHAVAVKHAIPPAAVAIAWFTAQPHGVIPLASARTIAQLEELFAGTSTRLDAEDLAALDWDAQQTAAA